MNRLVFIIVAAFLICSACNDVFFPEPVLPDSAFGKEEEPPNNVAASHGERRRITLSWDPAPGAALYHIYSSDSPLMEFVKCAETNRMEFPFDVGPGSTVYYRVSSVFPNGNVSRQSPFAVGNSLAQPIISDITETTNKNDDIVWTVYWYMGNDDAYKDNLMYNVYCYNGAETVREITVEGSTLSENSVEFFGLSPNINYTYQVEAFLSSDASASERSQILDAITARRLIPDAPVNLRASTGTSPNEIELAFELPEMVDVIKGINPETGENEFEPKPLFFVISKRVYTESGTFDFEKICLYFGLGNSDTYTGISGNKATFDEYVPLDEYKPGETVKWKDVHVFPNIIRRNVDYEYRVQSYVDETARTNISSDTRSRAHATGWAIREGDLKVTPPDYLPEDLPNEGDLFESASVRLIFSFDEKGQEYRYKVVETIKPITDYDEDDNEFVHDLTQLEDEIIWESDFFSFERVNEFSREMGFDQQTSDSWRGRGIYSYMVKIFLPDIDTPIDTVAAIGDWQISEDTSPFAITGFEVWDGYIREFTFLWNVYSGHMGQSNPSATIKYALWESADKVNWEEIPGSYEAVKTVAGDTRGWTLDGQDNGVTKYFGVQPVMEIDLSAIPLPNKKITGHITYGQEAYQTLGVPVLINSTGLSYSMITATWAEAVKADAYRIKYKYKHMPAAAWSVGDTVASADIAHDAVGLYRFSFEPYGSDDITLAGREILLEVDALNLGLQEKLDSDDEISLSSTEEVSARLIGPAELDVKASIAESANHIDVSWTGVPGANGYYVFRRQFAMDNSEMTDNDARIEYYVPANGSGVTGMGLMLEGGVTADTATVKAEISFNEGTRLYTLTDTYMADMEYSGTYRNHTDTYKNQQNELSWGFPYRYFVVPVIDSNGSPESVTNIGFSYTTGTNNKYADIGSYSVPGVVYSSNADTLEKSGHTIGFGQNVVATKGGGGDKVNITWELPPHLAAKVGFTKNYTVYRKRFDQPNWSTVGIVTGESYSDAPPDFGVVYDYVVGITNGPGTPFPPQSSGRFVEGCRLLASEEDEERGWYNMMGYVLNYARVTGASRDERKSAEGDFGELVQWISAPVGNNSGIPDIHWGLDGYGIWVLNRNDEGKEWRLIRYLAVDEAEGIRLDQTDQEAFVDNTTAMNGGPDLLRVMRDYKHFFCVRPYVVTPHGDVFGPPPPFLGVETDYVKWGARQITPLEFAKIASLHVTLGLNLVVGSGSNDTDDDFGWHVGGTQQKIASGNNGTGTVTSVTTSAYTQMAWTFANFRPSLLTKSLDRVTFLTVNGAFGLHRSFVVPIPGFVSGDVAPDIYGNNAGSQNYFDLIGPADVPGMYSGRMRFMNLRANNTGSMDVLYPATATVPVQIKDPESNTPLPFDNRQIIYVKGHPWVHARMTGWQ